MMTEVEEMTKKIEAKERRLAKKLKYRDPLHISYDMLTVYYNSSAWLTLNKRLLDSQNCWTNLEAIKEAHWLKLMIYDMINSEKNLGMLKELGKDLTEIEFELQRLWGFTEDARFHRFWEYPKCECPRLDNIDRYPTGQYVITSNCPLHWGESK